MAVLSVCTNNEAKSLVRLSDFRKSKSKVNTDKQISLKTMLKSGDSADNINQF